MAPSLVPANNFRPLLVVTVFAIARLLPFLALTPSTVITSPILSEFLVHPERSSALGLLISALSVLVMVAAVKAGNNGAEKVSVWWLVASYGVITVGELLLSPMGLSLVSKLSPERITSLMMGGWFLLNGLDAAICRLRSPPIWGSSKYTSPPSLPISDKVAPSPSAW